MFLKLDVHDIKAITVVITLSENQGSWKILGRAAANMKWHNDNVDC